MKFTRNTQYRGLDGKMVKVKKGQEFNPKTAAQGEAALLAGSFDNDSPEAFKPGDAAKAESGKGGVK